MTWKTLGALTTLVGSLGCGAEDLTLEALPPQAASTGELFKIGVLVDDASPAKLNLAAAANLAESQLNEGLERAGSSHRFEVVVVNYGEGQAGSAAIDLVNNQGVLGLVTDTDGTTLEVNRWNNQFVGTPPINHDIPLTCYQCSSPRFNRDDETELGFADPENWLFRTFFNGKFEAGMQAQVVLRRMRHGDLNHDGHVKVVVYYDGGQDPWVFNIATALDELHQGSHSTEFVGRTLPSSPQSRDAEMAFIYDDKDGFEPGHFPDVVVLAFRTVNGPAGLADYTNHAPLPPGMATRPPAQMTDSVRREHLLPALLASGGEGVEGSSVLRLANTSSGSIFRTAFVKATGQQPQVTASFLYDAVVTQAVAIAWAFHNGSTDPMLIQGNFPNVNDPGGRIIRPRPADYELAILRINQDLPINYEGAGGKDDLDFAGENFPDLVRWKIQDGVFVELENYTCNLEHPSCAR